MDCQLGRINCGFAEKLPQNCGCVFAEVQEVEDLSEGGEWVSATYKQLFREAMKSHLSAFREAGKTCNVAPGELIDDIKNGHEVAYIGTDFTWHTHPCGRTPSEADIKTNLGLGKRFLMIGLSPEMKTYVYDLGQKGKLVGTFK